MTWKIVCVTTTLGLMDWITQNFEEAVQPSMSNSSPGRKKIDFSTSFILLSTHNIYVSGDGSQGKLKTWVLIYFRFTILSKKTENNEYNSKDIFSDGLFHNSNQNIAHVCQAYQTTTKKRLKQVSVKELGLES